MYSAQIRSSRTFLQKQIPSSNELRKGRRIDGKKKRPSRGKPHLHGQTSSERASRSPTHSPQVYDQREKLFKASKLLPILKTMMSSFCHQFKPSNKSVARLLPVQAAIGCVSLHFAENLSN